MRHTRHSVSHNGRRHKQQSSTFDTSHHTIEQQQQQRVYSSSDSSGCRQQQHRKTEMNAKKYIRKLFCATNTKWLRLCNRAYGTRVDGIRSVCFFYSFAFISVYDYGLRICYMVWFGACVCVLCVARIYIYLHSSFFDASTTSRFDDVCFSSAYFFSCSEQCVWYSVLRLRIKIFRQPTIDRDTAV